MKNFQFSIFNFQWQMARGQLQPGFTLIELLVALSVFAIIAVFSVQSFSSVLQTSTKTEVLGNVRQEADYAVSVIERHLRGARGTTCVSNLRVDYTDINGRTSYFSCEGMGGSDPRVASEGARLTSEQVSPVSCNFTCPSISEVGISFTINQRQQTSDPRERAGVSVSSQVILRNQ